MRHRRPVRRNAPTLIEDLDALAARIAALEDEGEYFDRYTMVRPVLNRHLGHYFGPSADWINPTWSLGGNLYLVEGDYDNFNVISRTPNEDPDEPDVIEEVEELRDLDALRRYFRQSTRANPVDAVDWPDELKDLIAGYTNDFVADVTGPWADYDAVVDEYVARIMRELDKADPYDSETASDDFIERWEKGLVEAEIAVMLGAALEGRGSGRAVHHAPAPARRNPPRRPPPPPSLLDFQLQASAVQQGLFAPSSYEAKPKEKPAPVVDERQVDLFAPPPPKKNPAMRFGLRAGLRTMRENKGDHRYVRRAPVLSRTGEAKRERRYRYTYDPAEATRTNLPARVGEKLRIPHKGVMGHYEVVGRLADDVVGVLHDETGHAMAITDVALRELARDIYRPAPGTTPEEDIRHRHEREDALPRSRYETLKAIIDASGIQDHDFARADAAYHAWKIAGTKQDKAKIEGEAKKTKGKKTKKTRGPRTKRPPKPPPWEGGQLDPFEADLKRGKHYSSLLEAFEHATRGARTWRDLEPAMNLLRDVPGFADARFPDDVYERHNQHEMELKDQDHTIDVDLYGATLAGNTPSDVAEAVFLASTTTPPGLQKPLTEEELAYMAREEAGGEEAGDGDDLSLGF